MSLGTDPVLGSDGRPSDEVLARLSFAGDIRGQEPRPIDMALAHLMRDVYDYDRDGQEGYGDWRPLGADELRKSGVDPTLLENKSSGFLAAMYGDGHGHYVLAYSGTDEPKDWLTNFGQGLGFETSQYNQAMALAMQAKVAYGDGLVLTGHSLGGGLAAAAAVATDTPAITFNAAGVHNRTFDRIGLDGDAAKEAAAQGLIRRYAVSNEILTELQENKFIINHLMPDAVGHKIELPDPDPLSFWQGLNPVKSIKHGIALHMIDSVIVAQELRFGQGFGGQPLLSDPEHPANGMYRQAVQQLQDNGGGRLGKASPEQIGQLAGELVAEARQAGLGRIDSIAFSEDGKRVFAVEGGLDSPARKTAHADVEQGLRTPLSHSSGQAMPPTVTPELSPPEPGTVQRGR